MNSADNSFGQNSFWNEDLQKHTDALAATFRILPRFSTSRRSSEREFALAGFDKMKWADSHVRCYEFTNYRCSDSFPTDQEAPDELICSSGRASNSLIASFSNR